VVALLSPAPRLYRQTGRGIEEPAGGRGRRYWVVSRGLCRFFRIPALPEAAAARQIEALALQAKRLSPFVETGSHPHFGGAFIALWLWDQQAVRGAAAAIGVDVARLRVVPETALLPPAADGVRLVKTIDGVEGQNWIGGNLAASRWWPAPPDIHAWTLFQRGAAIAPDRRAVAVPAPVRLGWLERPWTHARSAGSFDIGRLDLRLVAAALAAVMLIAYLYLGAEWLRLARDLSGVDARIAAAARASAPVLRARAVALDNAAAIRAIQGLDRYPGQLALFARVTEILPKNETHLSEWSWERGQLEMTVAADHPLDALYFVRSLQRIRGFTNVVAERAGGDNSLRIRLAVAPR
jgi:hypothetical protein